jgi:hypothetical protein
VTPRPISTPARYVSWISIASTVLPIGLLYIFCLVYARCKYVLWVGT